MDTLIKYNVSYFNILCCCDFDYRKVIEFKKLELTFKNKKNKTLVLSFDKDDFKDIYRRGSYIDLSKLKEVERDFKLISMRRHLIFPAMFKIETENEDNVFITLNEPVPIKVLMRDYNSFIAKYNI